MIPRATIRALSTAVVLLCACGPAGCANAPWHKVPLDAASGFYGDAQLTYRLDAGKLGQPLDVVRVEGQQVSYDQVATSPLADESIGTLSILYPHPNGKAGYALARFVLESARPERARASTLWNPFANPTNVAQAPTALAGTQPDVHETWELDIASGESDQIFKMLNGVGFYNSDRPGGAARITVKMHGNHQSKNWDQLPALNLLIQRVRAEGRLVAYTRPTAGGRASGGPIASTVAYNTLVAGQETSAPHTNAVANAFSLAPRVPRASGNLPPVVLPHGGYPAVARQTGPGPAMR